MTKRSLLAATLAFGVVGFAGAARADEVDDTLKKLIDLDQRVHIMAMELRETQPVQADEADRRVLDAQVLYSLKNYEEAATILLDVVEKYPNTRAHDDALVLLGESLFQASDLYSARHYLQEAVAKNTGSKQEQRALQRLVEISLRTGDFDNVDGYLTRLQNLPPNQQFVQVAKLAGFQDWAAARGVPQAKSGQCLANENSVNQLVQITSDATAQFPNFQGTPTFVINGKMIPNVAAWDGVEPKLREALR